MSAREVVMDAIMAGSRGTIGDTADRILQALEGEGWVSKVADKHYQEQLATSQETIERLSETLETTAIERDALQRQLDEFKGCIDYEYVHVEALTSDASVEDMAKNMHDTRWGAVISWAATSEEARAQYRAHAKAAITAAIKAAKGE